MYWLRRVRRQRAEDGAAVVEFALVSIPLMILLLGIIQYGFYFYVAEATSGAASQVARRMAVGDCWDSTQRMTFAKSRSQWITGITTTPSTGPSGHTVGTTEIVVTVTADASSIEFLPIPNNAIVTREARTLLEDDVEGAACEGTTP